MQSISHIVSTARPYLKKCLIQYEADRTKYFCAVWASTMIVILLVVAPPLLKKCLIQYEADRTKYLCAVWTSTMIVSLLVVAPPLLKTCLILSSGYVLIGAATTRFKQIPCIGRLSCFLITTIGLLSLLGGISPMIFALPTAGVYLTFITMILLKVSLHQKTPSILQGNIIVHLKQITRPLHEVFLCSNRRYVFNRMWSVVEAAKRVRLEGGARAWRLIRGMLKLCVFTIVVAILMRCSSPEQELRSYGAEILRKYAESRTLEG